MAAKKAKKTTGKKVSAGEKFAKKNNKQATKKAASARKTWGKTKSPTKEMAY